MKVRKNSRRIRGRWSQYHRERERERERDKAEERERSPCYSTESEVQLAAT